MDLCRLGQPLNPHRTLLILKPDGYKRRLLIPVLKMIEHTATVVYIETMYLEPNAVDLTDYAAVLYEEHKGQPYYKDQIKFMRSGPIVVMELMGNHAVSRVREIVGYGSFPFYSGTIRGEFATSKRENVVHCSDSSESARRELALLCPQTDTKLFRKGR